MDQQSQQPVVEVDVVAGDARVRTALAALVNATPGLIVGRRLAVSAASSELEGCDRIILFDLDSIPSTLLDALAARGTPLVGLGNAPLPGNPAVSFVDKGAPTDAIADALRRAAVYVIRRKQAAPNVSLRNRPTTDAASSPQRGRSEPR